MNKQLQILAEKKIERTVKALNSNNYDAHYIPDPGALLKKLDEYMPEGTSCTVGGSVTLFDTGVIKYLGDREDLVYYDRYAQGGNPDEAFRKAFECDVYLTSSNAITEDGYLYNMDGNSNRVAAMIFGPKKVIVIAGSNKIVKDLEQARHHVREVAGPANNVRLATPNPCVKAGYCVDCRRATTTCATEVVFRTQRNVGRITVLLLPEHYGY